jgi:tetratricopeptide (TPR) repeat protein
MTGLTLQPKRKYAGSVESRRLAVLARAAGLGDSPDDALQLHRDALTLVGTDEASPFVADVLRWQATVLRDRGRTSEAEPLYTRSLELSIKLGYDAGHAHALNFLGSLAARRGDVTRAANMMTDALELAERCREKRLVGMIQQNLGILADMRGNPAAAMAHYRVSLRTFESANDLQLVCWVLTNLGYLHVKEGRYDEAHDALTRALGIARARGDLMTEAVVEENLAELFLVRGDVADAYAPIERAYAIADQRNDDLRRGAALKLRGAFERLSGRPEQATDALRHALTLSAVSEDALLGAEILYQFGLALAAEGDEKHARTAWSSALDAFERIAARQWVARVRTCLTEGPSGRYL